MRMVIPMRGRIVDFICLLDPRIQNWWHLMIAQSHRTFPITAQIRMIESIAHSRVHRLTNLRTSSYSALSLMSRKKSLQVRSTTVLLVRREERVAMAGAG